MRVVLDTMREPAAGATHIHQVVGAEAAALDDPGAAAKQVTFSVSGGDVRVRFDGVDPTATSGILLGEGGLGTWAAGTWKAALAIAASGSPVIDAMGFE